MTCYFLFSNWLFFSFEYSLNTCLKPLPFGQLQNGNGNWWKELRLKNCKMDIFWERRPFSILTITFFDSENTEWNSNLFKHDISHWCYIRIVSPFQNRLELDNGMWMYCSWISVKCITIVQIGQVQSLCQYN